MEWKWPFRWRPSQLSLALASSSSLSKLSFTSRCHLSWSILWHLFHRNKWWWGCGRSDSRWCIARLGEELFKKWCICAHWHWREFEFKMGLKSTFRHNHRGRRTGSVVQGVSDEVHGTCLISMFSMTCEKSNLFPGAPWRRWSWRPPTHQPWCFPALESPLDPSPHRPLLPLSLWGESLRL